MDKNSLKYIVQNQIEVKLDGSSNVLLLGNGINRDIYKLTEEEKKDLIYINHLVGMN